MRLVLQPRSARPIRGEQGRVYAIGILHGKALSFHRFAPVGGLGSGSRRGASVRSGPWGDPRPSEPRTAFGRGGREGVGPNSPTGRLTPSWS